jgi:hypothetical protein
LIIFNAVGHFEVPPGPTADRTIALRRSPFIHSFVRALDPVAQISLFEELKLLNCADFARAGNHAGCLFDQVRS